MGKIDIAKLLVDCPEGMGLDSPHWADVTLVSVDPDYEHYSIRLKTRSGLGISLTRYPFICMGYNNHYSQCIPYECNEKLLGTTKDCAEFYKTW